MARLPNTLRTPTPRHRSRAGLAAGGAALAAMLFLAGCAGGTSSADNSRSAVAKTPVPGPERAMATARLVTPQSAPAGNAVLTDTAAGVEVAIQVQGLAPGQHGFHIHANGACAPGPDAATGQTVAFGAAGGHFDPGMSKKHGRPGQSAHEAHAGELPNIPVGDDGRGSVRYVNSNITLTPGKASVVGRALVVHEKEDDYTTNPAGNSGGRLLCGVIEPALASTVVGDKAAVPSLLVR
ncbi:superoxide dismutase family protein [Paracidovorax valerianellae]|uniref:Superoxide dismutase, Cu-Zn family n=1 Tax=Paracidovorax valerianellae TaxID=187868 RepID=A0A1G6U9B1_9BURK|nr:superoxide dismutase family protein [Paracidovorax valerianellae]MDA8446751.1 superoxide dismutase family protein [Paracidovorax valerianellae]SDD37871.1 superoxide dismutase, Cu-Zn family [Paracidovorax valerianellae]